MRTPKIRKLRRRGDVEGLVAALDYFNHLSIGAGETVDAGVPVRLRALEALSEIGSAEEVSGISVALRDPDPTVRLSAVRLICKLDPAAAVDGLAGAFVGPPRPEFEVVRREALEGLKAMLVEDRLGVVSRVAVNAIHDVDDIALDNLTMEGLMSLAEKAPPEEINALITELIDQLAGTNGSVERTQVTLAWLGKRSVKPLIAALDREGGYREPAAAVLGTIRDSQALESLSGILTDRRADVRRVAAWALGELRDPRTAEPLMRATMDDEYEVRRQAGEALDSMGSIALMAGVANMIRSLEDRGDTSAVARLVEEGLERTPPSVQVRAAGSQRWVPRFIERFQLRQHQ